MSALLMLLPSVPQPLDSGAKIRNLGLLKALASENDVDAIAFGDPTAPADELRRLVRRLAVVAPPPTRTRLRRALDLARADLPDMAQRLWSPDFLRIMRCLTDTRRYDLVQAEGIEMARYLAVVSLERRAYDAHNAEFLLQRRLASSGTLLARAYSRVQAGRLERFERALVRDSRLTLAVSQHDANQLRALTGPACSVQVVPNAIDVGAYPFRTPHEPAGRNLLFVGKLDFRPNAEAMRWFIEHVLPRLEDVRLFAVGDSPPDWLVRRGQHDTRVVVTGYVADEERYWGRAAALVVPTRTGGGSRLKALVAMATGVPIVSTRVGMEGLVAEPGRHFVAAESPADWASGLQRVLTHSDVRRSIVCNARALVEQRYDWTSVRADVLQAYAFLKE